MRWNLFSLILTSFCLLFSGCNSDYADMIDPTASLDETSSLTKAHHMIHQKEYYQAIKLLEKYQTEYPLSIHIPNVEKMLIYCYFYNQDYPMLQAASDRFLFEHVDDQHADYIAYLRFIAAEHLAKGYPYEWLPIERAMRDVSSYKDAFLMGKNFLITYPESVYAADVAHRLPSLKEMVARSYFLRGEMLLSRKEIIGGVRSLQMVLNQFADTPYAEDAQKMCDKVQSSLQLIEERHYSVIPHHDESEGEKNS